MGGEPDPSVSRRAFLLGTAAGVSTLGLGATGVAVYHREDEPETPVALEGPPFEPTDTDLFSPVVYEETPPLEPATERTAEPVRRQLRELFARRFDDPDLIEQGMAIFDSSDLESTVSDDRLRAATAAMFGTVAEPSLERIQSRFYERVEFVPFASEPTEAIARVDYLPNRDAYRIELNERFQFEDFRRFIKTIAHETLHQDTEPSPTEELIAHSIDILIYATVLLESPELAGETTELARRHNTHLMARLNARDETGTLRLLEAQGSVYPGGEPTDSYVDAVNGTTSYDTPGNEVLLAYLRAISEELVVFEPRFDNETVSVLDRGQVLVEPTDLLVLSDLLRLDTDPSRRG